MSSVVSVVIPVYNTEPYLEECIESVVNQTYEALEILLINDGSTDGSGAVCKKWEKLDRRIRYIEKENEGQGAARTLGIRMATGEYLIFVDSDDYIDAQLVDRVRSCICEQRADICSFSHQFIGERMVKWSLEGKSRQGCSVKEHPVLLGLMLPILCNKMFSLPFLKNSGVTMTNRMCEDLVFNARLYVKAGRVCFLDQCFYNYRYLREGNLTANYQRYFEVEQSIDELNESFQREGYFETYWISLYELSMYIFKNILFRIKNKEELHLPREAEEKYPELWESYKNCLARWFSPYLLPGLQEKNYILIGSYNLRVIVHCLLLEESFLKRDYGFTSLISLMSESAGLEGLLKNCTFQNPYRRRCVEQDVKKSFSPGTDFQGMDYLVMDLLDETWDLIRITENCYLTESEFLKELGLESLKAYDRIPFLSGERRRLFGRHVSLFAEKIRQARIPVVILKNFLCGKHSVYYDVSWDYDQAEQIERYNQELEWCYQQLAAALPEAVVAEASEFQNLAFTHEAFPFGCQPIYYNAGYYQRMAVEMNRSIRKGAGTVGDGD